MGLLDQLARRGVSIFQSGKHLLAYEEEVLRGESRETLEILAKREFDVVSG
ncbi:hypothetical protein ACFOKF_23000 [Sphingobium rhizovicinum]|uniref:Uncharacterized protein n=1 Tax=Sphingobium rhizovicinum TaxID=432308 RepID=A0ABV7NNL4_9SPHN